jgi:hypothetical protein
MPDCANVSAVSDHGLPDAGGAQTQMNAAAIAARWIAQHTDATNPHNDPALPLAVDRRCDRLHPDVVRILRGMSGMERLRLAHEAWELARDRLTAFVGAVHPDWTPERVAREVAARLGSEHTV